MAQVNAEHEDAIREWIKGFEALPEDRQDALKRWFATQKVIIDASGLTPVEWFSHIQWAMDHPFDYSFIMDFPDAAEGAGVADGTERGDATRGARNLVGAQTVKTAPTEGTKGITEKGKAEKGVERELFDRFMRERLGGGRK